MKDATLIITAWRRPDYLRQALASWALVPELSELRKVVIALGPSDRVTEQLGVISDFADVASLPVEVRPDSLACAAVPGEHRALAEAITAAFTDSECGFAVVSSEDVIVSDDVLRYFAWGRTLQRLVVCAHNDLGQGWQSAFDDFDADQSAVRLRPTFSPWCWGTNPLAWDMIIEREWDYDCSSGGALDSGWDWQMYRLISQVPGRLAVMPDASRAQNIGKFDGVYADPEHFQGTVARSFRWSRGAVDYRLVP